MTIHDSFYSKPDYIDIPRCLIGQAAGEGRDSDDYKLIAKRLGIHNLDLSDAQQIKKKLEEKMIHLSEQLSTKRFKSYTKGDIEKVANFLEVFFLWIAQRKTLKVGWEEGQKFEKKIEKVIKNLENLLENWDSKGFKAAKKVMVARVSSQVEKLFSEHLSTMKQRTLGKPIQTALAVLNEKENEP